MSDTLPVADGKTTVVLSPVLEAILTKGKMFRLEDQKPGAAEMVQTFALQVHTNELSITAGQSAAKAIKERITKIDELISAQLNEILHHPDFQRLEASWRGLRHLVFNSETGTRMKLRVLNARQDELAADLEKAVEFDQSNLFKKLYEEEYGTFGGHPYSFLVADFEITRSKPDVTFLQNLSHVAAAAHAPVIAAAAPELFDLGSFADLGTPRDLAKIFESADMVDWGAFRKSDDARYVALVLPHVLMRLPYDPETLPVNGMDFKEEVRDDREALVIDGVDDAEQAPRKAHDKYLWGNAAWVLAERITNAFSLYGWCAAIRGVEGGGKVEGLPTHTFEVEKDLKALKCPTEVAITDRREKELSDLGFISLCHCKGEAYAAFFGGATVQKPKTYNTNEANANARISAVLPYVLAASRFAHYLKVIMRDKIGSFQSKEDVSKFLNTWIAGYVLLADGAPQAQKAGFPLREGRVDVSEVPGRPGSYNATVFLRPHFQLEELTASIRLVATLPPPAAA
jgi:type VI secretion system protein ImpC